MTPAVTAALAAACGSRLPWGRSGSGRHPAAAGRARLGLSWVRLGDRHTAPPSTDGGGNEPRT
ncbi:hypothetical protein KCP71_11145 [Salmonella enterica subsp. enterica]|nr:hypothetical protein KCP71_11145 [Salmonella enterica subsp. enterica]